MASKRKGEVETHVCRFIDYEPCSVSALSVDNWSKYAAVGRSNGNIEIWNLDGSFIERLIPGKGENSVQCLILFSDDNGLRLVSGGLDGWLYEWNLESLDVKFCVSCQASGIWDIKIHQMTENENENENENGNKSSMIACACDDGNIRIYRLTNDELIYQCTFACSQRCLSVSWNNNNIVYGGTSDGLIFGFNFLTRKEVIRIVVIPPSVAGVRKKQAIKPLIWSIVALNDKANGKNEIACSTSRGTIDIYDSEFGTLIQSCNVSKNDILKLDYFCENSKNGETFVIDTLYGGCVDGRVIELTRRSSIFVNEMTLLKKTRQSEFVMTGYHRYHTHDVNCVCVSNDMIISGGNDTQLIVCNNRNLWNYHMCSPLSYGFNNGMAFQSPLLSIANDVAWIDRILPSGNDNSHKNSSDNNDNKLKKVLFLHNNLKSKKFELWHMYDNVNGKVIKILEIDCGFDSKEKKGALCCGISPNGEWILATNEKNIKLWKIEINNKNELKLVRMMSCSKRGCSSFAFTNDCKQLILAPICNNDGKSKGKHKDKDKEEKDKDKSDDLGMNDINCSIVCIDLSDKNNISICKSIKINEIFSYLITSLTINNDASLCGLTIASLNSGIVVNMENGGIFYQIPKGLNKSKVCHMSFHCVRKKAKNKNKKKNKNEIEFEFEFEEQLYIIYSNNRMKIVVYPQISNKENQIGKNDIKLHPWCNHNTQSWNEYNHNNCFSFLKSAFNPNVENKVLLIRPEYICSLPTNKDLPLTIAQKNVSKKEIAIENMVPSPFGKPSETEKQSNRNIKKQASNHKHNHNAFLNVIRKFDPIMLTCFIDGDVLLVVHPPWSKVSNKFKQPIYRKRYAI